MALEYDKEIFEKFRELAVTELSEIEVGVTLYSNTYPKKFVVVDLITTAELHKRLCRGYAPPDANTIAWIVTDNASEKSLRDRNVGASYNPWLLFKSEEVRDECVRRLKVTWHEDDDWNGDWIS